MFRFGTLLVLMLAIMSQPVLAKSIVILGDSISAGYGVAPGEGWVDLLRTQLEGHAIHNESISGDTSAGGLERIDRVLAAHRPDVVVLALGGNDGLRGLSPSAMKENLGEIIRRSRAAGARVLLVGMKLPPNYGQRFIDLFYGVYPQLAQALEVPLMPFLLEGVALDPGKMQDDGLHPNEQAQPVIAANVKAHLLPLLDAQDAKPAPPPE